MLGVIVEVYKKTDRAKSVMIVESNSFVLINETSTKLSSTNTAPIQLLRTAKLHGARMFTVLDAMTGYWRVKLDTKSSLLTTFNTSSEDTGSTNRAELCTGHLPEGNWLYVPTVDVIGVDIV